MAPSSTPTAHSRYIRAHHDAEAVGGSDGETRIRSVTLHNISSMIIVGSCSGGGSHICFPWLPRRVAYNPNHDIGCDWEGNGPPTPWEELISDYFANLLSSLLSKPPLQTTRRCVTCQASLHGKRVEFRFSSALHQSP